MLWRFTLIDRYDNKTVIDEPVGWDSFSIKIKRHPQRHGTFRELQGNQFQFHGEAQTLLKAEHDLYGIRGDYRLRIDWKCGFRWEEYFTGTISFDTYDFICGPSCYVIAEIEQIGPIVSFINRFDQKVEVGKALGFDQVTVLTAYDKLTQTILLPSKTILQRGIAKNTALHNYVLSNDSGWNFPLGTGRVDGSINVAFDNVEVNSIKDFSPSSITDFYRHVSSGNEYTPEIILNNPEQDLNCRGNNFNLEFRVKGRYKNTVTGSGNNSLFLILRRGPNNFNDGVTNTTIQSWEIRASDNAAFSQEFDINYSGVVALGPSEKLWLDNFIIYVKTTNYDEHVEIEYDLETFFKASVESRCDPTTAKIYLINETASRITEAITNNGLKVYSKYLGRHDSQPYSFSGAGCGALRALTLGLDIRNAKLGDGTDPKLFLSMQDIFDHLAATDNIGLGTEGNDKIRIENWKWFYKSTVIHSCTDIDTIDNPIKADQHFSIFKNGYDKWETEDYNGLDEIHTKREYRTQITQVQNTMEQVSKILASGYAIEVTRRKQKEDKDWRYDNDVFALCLNNKLTISVQFITALGFGIKIPPAAQNFFVVGHQVQVTGTALNDGTYTIVAVTTIFLLGTFIIVAEPVVDETVDATFEDITSAQYTVEIGNIDSAANLVDPPTVYNYRISPERNAMRWFDRIAEAYRNITNADKLIFSSGEGNYIAEGKLKDPICRLEADVLKESDDISLETFEDSENGLPIIFAESIKFKYPLGAGDFKKISLNIYDQIYYESNCLRGNGWINELEHFPNEGLAKFDLIPSTDVATEPAEGIITEDGINITNEDRDNILTG